MDMHPDPFDKYIKEAMKGHGIKPREEARKAFLEEAGTLLPVRKSGKIWFLLPIAAITIAVVLFWILSGIDDTPSITPVKFPEPAPALSGPSSLNNSDLPDDNDRAPEYAPGLAASAANRDQAQKPVQFSEHTTHAGNASVTFPGEPGHTNTSILQDRQIHEKAPDSLKNDPLQAENTPAAVELNIPPDTTALSELPPADEDTSGHPPQTEELKWRPAAGVYFLPELMFNTVEGEKLVTNAGLEAIFYKGPISLRTGIGISVSKGMIENEIAYHDYLGSYNKLDSITFLYNQAEQVFEPKIYTSAEKVWDERSLADSSEVISRYTYLQIPLVLGFDFWQSGRLAVGVRIGTAMSVMLASKQLTGEYDPGEDMVVGISQLSPSQVRFNWQAIGGFSATAMISRRINLEIEPQARYYYGSIYERSNNLKKPWSLGIRAAVVYKF